MKDENLERKARENKIGELILGQVLVALLYLSAVYVGEWEIARRNNISVYQQIKRDIGGTITLAGKYHPFGPSYNERARERASE